MTKGLPRSRRNAKPTNLAVVRQVVKVKDLAITVNGATGVGFGTAVMGDIPEGNILLLGAVSYMIFTKVTAAGVQDTFDGDYAIGSAPNADADFGDTVDSDVIPSTALGAATAGVSPSARGTNATQVILDNTDGSLELNLSLLIDDANISADTQLLKANGYLVILYSVLGDD